MAIGTQNDSDQMLSEINMIPFIDVMLVLLIIFIITVPVINHAVRIDLPQASNEKLLEKPENVQLTIDAAGQFFWNDEPVSDDAIVVKLESAATRQPQPELHIRGDKAVRYERVAKLMSAAQNAGVHRIGFVTDPHQTAQTTGGTP